MLTFDEDTHTYWWETESAKVRVPGVTEIMKATGISKDFRGIDPYVLDRARRRGTAVHEITEILDRGLEPDMSMVDADIYDDVCNMVDAWEGYKKDYDVEIVHIEAPVVMLDYLCVTGDLKTPLFAGTVDRATAGDEHGEIILDIKTSSTLSNEVSVQLMLYAWAYRHYYERDTTSIQAIRLGKDGKYYVWRQGFLSDEWQRVARIANDTIYRYHNWEIHKNKRGMRRC
jgi:hypothetical protein